MMSPPLLLILLSVLLLLGPTSAAFIHPPDDSVCSPTRVNQSLAWFHSHTGSAGLVLSYISDKSWTINRGYTYGNALAAISLLLHTDSAASPHLPVAEGILDALSNALVTDATNVTAKYSLFYCDINSGSCDGSIRSGQNAWVAESFALHWLITGDSKYEDALTGICNYLLVRLEASGDKGCVTGGPDVTWCSVEHAIDSYFVLHLAAYLTGNQDYRTGASTIATGLYGDHMWHSAHQRFKQGYDDSYFAMDVNSWGSIFLLNNEEVVPVGVDSAARVSSSLSHVDSMYLSDQICVLNNDTATGYGPYADLSNDFHAKVVWSEGTLGVALAYRRNGELARVNTIVDGLDPMWGADGSYLYAAAETVVDNSGERFYPYPSDAGTGWYGLACGNKSWAFWNADSEMYEAVFGTFLNPDASRHPTAEPTSTPTTGITVRVKTCDFGNAGANTNSGFTVDFPSSPSISSSSFNGASTPNSGNAWHTVLVREDVPQTSIQDLRISSSSADGFCVAQIEVNGVVWVGDVVWLDNPCSGSYDPYICHTEYTFTKPSTSSPTFEPSASVAPSISPTTFDFPAVTSVCNTTRTLKALDWIHNNRGSSGLVLSYISDKSWTINRGYTYGNALAAISLLLHTDSAASPHLPVAEGILDALSNALVTDATNVTAKYSLFYCDINSGSCDGSIRSGQNAWVAESFALHWLITGDSKYEDALTGICNYLLVRLEASGDKGCVTGGPDVTWCAVEHAIDSYFVLHLAAYLTGNQDYRTGASTIATGLYGDHMWDTASNWFRKSYDSTSFAMDVHSWGSIFLLNNGEMVPAGVDTESRVEGTLARCDDKYLSDQICVLNNRTATGYGPYAEAVNNFHSEAVWSEGTLGVALAYRRKGDISRMETIVDGIDPLWGVDGSYLYAAAETVVDNGGEKFYPLPSIAGTGWFALACADNHWAFWNANNGMYDTVYGTFLNPEATKSPSSQPTITHNPTAAIHTPTSVPSEAYVGITVRVKTCDFGNAGANTNSGFTVDFPSSPSISSSSFNGASTPNSGNAWHTVLVREDVPQTSIQDLRISSSSADGFCVAQIEVNGVVWVGDVVWLDNPCSGSYDPYICHTEYTFTKPSNVNCFSFPIVSGYDI